MADEKSTNQNQQNEQEQGKAMGAAANAGAHWQERSGNSPSETAGQGGGIQGSGQRQPNPGGYTEGEERDRSDNQASSDRGSNPTQGE
jgi:hypothetical protein